VDRDTPVRLPETEVPVVVGGGGENVSVRPALAVRRALSALTVVVFTATVAACGGAAPATPQTGPSTSAPAVAALDAARAELAARAALAVDRRFAALYTLTVPGQQSRSVVATVATDGSWRVDIPDSALGGTADVSIVQTATGVFQCSLPSEANPIRPACVRVANRGGRIPNRYDPRVERVFRTWLSVFTDRQAALSVTSAQPLPGSTGECFSIDSISASMDAPVDVGIYCYADDGLLTAARVNFGELTIATAPAAAPASVDLPGPVVAGEPMGMDAPPPTTPPVVPSSVAPSA
jgi:hypothetical protein